MRLIYGTLCHNNHIQRCVFLWGVLLLLAGFAQAATSPGLVLETFGNPRLDVPQKTEIAAAVRVDGQDLGMDGGLRYRGLLTPPATGDYLFRISADTGVRLTIGTQRIIDGWAADGARDGHIQLKASEPVSFTLEYYFDKIHGGRIPTLSIWWTPPGQGETPMPANIFSHAIELPIILGNEQQRLDKVLPDGGLPLLPGVLNLQLLRATHDRPALADTDGWTYAHHMDLAVWQGRLYAAWAMTPKDEDVAPYKVVYATSVDGITWSAPADLFPRALAWACRFYFYRASNGRMLTFCSTDPKDKGEAKSVLLVREITADHQLGNVFTLIGAQPNLPPLYDTAPDQVFVAACREAVANNLLLEQQDYGTFLGNRRIPWHANAPVVNGWKFGKAMCFYHCNDKTLVSIGKMGFVTTSKDEGKNWSKPVVPSTLKAGGGKVWGQKTTDGRYVLLYNPRTDQRYPLILVHGDDGYEFRDMRVVHGEVPSQRYAGLYKGLGPQYMRGLAEWSDDGSFVDKDALWMIYSMNKEDIWLSRIPVPIATQPPAYGTSDFQQTSLGSIVAGWNLYCPRWAPVSVVAEPGNPDNRCLELRDGDPFDYAQATRLFPVSTAVEVRLRIKPMQTNAVLEIDVTEHSGKRPLRLSFTAAGHIQAVDGARQCDLGAYQIDEWCNLALRLNLVKHEYTISINDKEVGTLPVADASIQQVQRLVIRTGAWRGIGKENVIGAGTDIPLEHPAVFLIDDVAISAGN